MQSDVAFGLRQLVDIALRALSPGVHDPTTAVQALDRIHDVLGMLVDRDMVDPWIRESDGTPRAWIPSATWEDLVALALDELRLAGAGQLQLHRRMLQLLDDLIDEAPEHRREPLVVRRELLAASAGASFDEPFDRLAAGQPDATGTG